MTLFLLAVWLQTGASASDAIPLAAGSATGRITAEQREVWYRLDATAGTLYSVLLAPFGEGDDALGDPHLERWAPRGDAMVAEDDDSGGNRRSLMIWEAVDSGPVLLKARPHAEGGVGSFQVTVAARESRPGDAPESAVTLAEGTPAEGAIDLMGVPAWYRFEAGEDQVYALELAGAGVEGALPLVSPSFELFSEPGRAIDRSSAESADAPARLPFVCREAGDPLVKVTPSNPDRLGGFRLSIASRPMREGDAADRPIPLAPGEPVAGEIVTPGLAAWYAFDAGTDRLYVVTVEGDSLAEAHAGLYNEAGRDEIAGGERNARFVWSCGRAGSYRLRVQPAAGRGVGTFRVAVEEREAGAGETRGTPIPLDLGRREEGEVPAGMPRRWYRFYAQAWRQYTIEVRHGTLEDPVVELYGLEGESAIGQDDDSGGGRDARLVWLCPAGGHYLLAVRPYSAGAGGTFEIAVTEREPGPGEAPSTPVLLEPGATVRGSLTASGVYWYRFVPRPGARYRFRLNAVTVRDPVLELYDETGQRMLADDDDGGGDRNALILWESTGSEPLMLRARSYSGGERGEYDLILEEDPF